MDRSFDMVAVILYVIFGSVVFFLIHFLFDIKNIFGRIRTHIYMFGHPEHKELESSEGVIEVEDGKVSFKELLGQKEYFSIPLKEINNVSTSREGEGSPSKVLRGISNLLAERDYLFIEFNRKDKNHILKFSTHRASPVNNELKKQILKARDRVKQEIKF